MTVRTSIRLMWIAWILAAGAVAPRAQVSPAVERIPVTDGSLIFRQALPSNVPAAIVGGGAVFAPSDSRLPAPASSILPFVNGDAMVVVARRPADRKLVAYMRDSNRGTLEPLYERPDENGLAIDATDWSLANQVFLYEHQVAGAARWLGRTIRVTVFPRETVDLTARYNVRGIPSVDSAGKRVVFLSGPDDALGQPYHLELLDLQTGAKRTIFERTGTRVIVQDGRPTMTATRPRWTKEDTHVVFADTDHAVEGSPTVFQIPVADGAGARVERRLTESGKAVDLLLGPSGTAYVLMSQAPNRYLIVAVDMATGSQHTVLSRAAPVEMVGIAP